MWLALLLLLLIHCIFITAIPYENINNYECETNLNCTRLVRYSICFNKKCVCQFGYKENQCILDNSESYYHQQMNSGIRMLGEECDRTNQCRHTPIDGSKICSSNKCQCSFGYIPIDAYRCIRDFEFSSVYNPSSNSNGNEPPGYGSACSINKDCQHTTNHLECIHGACACLDGYVPLGKYLCYNLRTQSTSITPTSSMISTILSTITTTTATDQPIINAVIKSLGKIGNSCTNDYFCRRTVPESHCYNGKCTCIDGYISIDQYTCMKNMNEQTTTISTPIPVDYKSLLGGKCLTKRNCHTSNAVCLDSICTCPKRYFPVDDWTCLLEPESSDEELIETTSIKSTTATTTLSTTTAFRWWPWSPTPTTPRQTYQDLQNTFRFRCLLNRQCASMDKNSHCTLFGRCTCNRGYKLETTHKGQHCIKQRINDDDCD